MILVFYYPHATSHLALATTGLSENIYLSFFPANEKSLADFRLHGFFDDKKQTLTKVIVLPSEESSTIGLSEQAIYDWFKNDFNPKERSFNWFTQNCSAIIYEALIVAQKKSLSLDKTLLLTKKGFFTPSNILNYAHKLGKKLYEREIATLQQLLTANINLSDFIMLAGIKINAHKTPLYTLDIHYHFCIYLKNIFSDLKKIFAHNQHLTQWLNPTILENKLDHLLFSFKNISAHFYQHYLKLYPEKKSTWDELLKQHTKRLMPHLAALDYCLIKDPLTLRNLNESLSSILKNTFNPQKEFIQSSERVIIPRLGAMMI